MALEMKTCCAKCSSELNGTTEAYICSYECTFCSWCAVDMMMICPNCEGELKQRPRRIPSEPNVLAA